MRSTKMTVGTVMVLVAGAMTVPADASAQDSRAARAAAEALARVRAGIAEARPAMPTPSDLNLQEDPASQAYQAAREALNRRRYSDAAERFEEMRDRYASSAYVPDSYYWQAFALFREGGNGNLRRAMELLNTQAEQYIEANTRADADALMVRIEAGLARRGTDSFHRRGSGRPE